MWTAQKILAILTPRERRRGALVVVLMVVLATIEVAGVASVMPFLAVLGDPDLVQRNPYLALLYERLGFQDTRSFLVALGVFALLVLVFAAVFRSIAHFTMFRYANMRRHSVSRRLLAGHLRQPYEFFLTRNSADLSKTILSEVDQLTTNVMRPAIEVVAYGTAALAIIILLFVADPVLAAIVTGTLLGFYALIYGVVRGLLGRIGRDRVAANAQRFRAAAEALAGIQELKVLGRERAFFDAFDPASSRYARHQATNQALSLIPKYLVEAVGFGAIFIVALYALGGDANLGQALPIVGLYALAGHRLLPAAQHVYAGMAKLQFGVSAVDTVLAELNAVPSRGMATTRAVPPMPLRRVLELRDVSYAYPGGEVSTLVSANLTIEAGTTVGIIGSTGAGKSTLVSVILGLLRPRNGAIYVDGIRLDDDRVPAWQRSIGYVPQHIFLVDDTVARNIALGIPPEEIDRDALRRAARAAQIHDFIEEELPAGYETTVGERGVRLSGGQRQRLVLARALYRDPAILVFDEATSALDHRTESAVMEAIERLSGTRTIILVAHRLTSLRGCDAIYEMYEGRVMAETSQELKRVAE